MRVTGRARVWLRVLCAALAADVLVAAATTAYGAPLGRTTEQASIAPGAPLDPAKPGYLSLVDGPAWPRITRTLGGAAAAGGRTDRRRSLAYFGQFTDFQLADEESPARVEFLDVRVSGSAWRPQEALHPQVIDASIRQMNSFVPRSPHPQAGDRRAKLGFTLLTGDLGDSQQRNEAIWVRQLIDGERIDPNSGTDATAGCSPAAQAVLGTKPGEARKYTGVQDYDDYGPLADYYDPDQPSGALYGEWPRYANLMDRAQQPFDATGLDVPSYIARGNHDVLVQGNEEANPAFEGIATGCDKPFAIANPENFGGLAPSALLQPPAGAMIVPPDDGRRYVTAQEIKQIYQGKQADAHGFGLVDPAENAASGGAASYYAWSPAPGFRFVAVDTNAEGGRVPTPDPSLRTDEGNIDDPQFRWVEKQLKEAQARDEMVVLFGHHPIRSLVSTVADEESSPCGTGNDAHGHDRNIGCDKDPRDSQPLHTGDDRGSAEGLRSLLNRYPNVTAFVTGHTHENAVRPCGLPDEQNGCPKTSGWWEINTAAVADWPQQSRLIELMDNADGTLSIFSTVLDHGSPTETPGSGTDAAGLGEDALGALSRALSFNDPQADRAKGAEFGAEGEPKDRNVELLVPDPRKNVKRCLVVAKGGVKGTSLPPVRLGATRAQVRKLFPSAATARGSTDDFCVAGGGRVRVGYVSGRGALAITSSRLFTTSGVGAGSKAAAIRKRFKGARSFRRGGDTWYVHRGKSSTTVFHTRGGRVHEIGIADARLTRTLRDTRRLLKAMRA